MGMQKDLGLSQMDFTMPGLKSGPTLLMYGSWYFPLLNTACEMEMPTLMSQESQG
jgi:hypothetical protein